MSEPIGLSGKCLCGAVTFTVTSASKHVGACHCGMCRKWSGGILLALEGSTDLKISGEDNLSVYKSSDWGERIFCKTCGSNLFWRSPTFGTTEVMAGAIDDPAELSFVREIFIDHKLPYLEFANATEKLTGSEFLARFGLPEDQQN